jgi:hypothetical protein
VNSKKVGNESKKRYIWLEVIDKGVPLGTPYEDLEKSERFGERLFEFNGSRL